MDHGMHADMGPAMGAGWLVGAAMYALLIVVPFWQLWRRTGHSGWISVLMVVPLLNLILLWVLAFKDWPAVRRGGGT